MTGLHDGSVCLMACILNRSFPSGPPEQDGPAPAYVWSRPDNESVLFGDIHAVLEARPGYMHLGLDHKQMCLGVEEGVYFLEKMCLIRNLMYHPESQSEINVFTDPQTLLRACMPLDALLHARLGGAML